MFTKNCYTILYKIKNIKIQPIKNYNFAINSCYMEKLSLLYNFAVLIGLAIFKNLLVLFIFEIIANNKIKDCLQKSKTILYFILPTFPNFVLLFYK